MVDLEAAVKEIERTQRPLSENPEWNLEQLALDIVGLSIHAIRQGRKEGYPACCIWYFTMRSIELLYGGHTCRPKVENKEDKRIMCEECCLKQDNS